MTQIYDYTYDFLFGRHSLNRLDILAIVGILFVSLLFGFSFYDFDLLPEEDAAILMRYSVNMADGHGIVWNIGEDPVDGATDFLLMVVLAGLVKAGFGADTGVQVIGFVSHLATVGVVYLAVRRLWKNNRAIALISAAIVGFGPGLGYVEGYFGTPMFAFFAVLAWYFAIEYTQGGAQRTAALFAIFGLLTGLTRPEGVLLAGFMLVAIIFYCGPRESLRAIVWFGGVFAVIGGAYFLWRWSYFDYPLPNPFYKKGGGSLYTWHLREAINIMFYWTFPVNLAIFAGFRTWEIAKRTIFALIPIAGFVGIWVLLSDETNYLFRFQYAGLPLFAMSWSVAIDKLGDGFELRERFMPNWVQGGLVLLMLAVGLLGSVYATQELRQEERYRDGRYDVALMLSEYSDQDYTIAMTEAGLLPFYSTWDAIDTWGLNDQWIAHNDGITEEYLAEFEPEIIMYHAYYSPYSLEAFPGEQGELLAGWQDMLDVLEGYAEDNSYILAAVYGNSPFDTHYYYVSLDFPESDELVRRLRELDYTWHSDGDTAFNFIEESDSESESE